MPAPRKEILESRRQRSYKKEERQNQQFSTPMKSYRLELPRSDKERLQHHEPEPHEVIGTGAEVQLLCWPPGWSICLPTLSSNVPENKMQNPVWPLEPTTSFHPFLFLYLFLQSYALKDLCHSSLKA